MNKIRAFYITVDNEVNGFVGTISNLRTMYPVLNDGDQIDLLDGFVVQLDNLTIQETHVTIGDLVEFKGYNYTLIAIKKEIDSLGDFKYFRAILESNPNSLPFYANMEDLKLICRQEYQEASLMPIEIVEKVVAKDPLYCYNEDGSCIKVKSSTYLGEVFDYCKIHKKEIKNN